MKLDIPANDVAEISLLGTGGGYGESLVVHLGNQNWIVIDSCCNPVTGQSLPLQYLNSIGISPQHVQLIVCTHWHDDHVNGLSQLTAACPEAKICFSWGHKPEDVVLMLELDHFLPGTGSKRSTKELGRVLNLLQQQQKQGRPSRINQAPLPRRILFPFSSYIQDIYLMALSPADTVVKAVLQQVAQLNEKLAQNPAKSLIYKKPNMLSVACWIRLQNHAALLGADVEIAAEQDEGWNAILAMEHPQRAGVFKIPHHGSQTGYEPRVWEQLLYRDPLAILTPWNRNQKLPQPDMVTRYKEHTANLYITSGHTLGGMSEEDAILAACFAKEGVDYQPVVYEYGHVRCRINFADPAAGWEVALDGAAQRL